MPVLIILVSAVPSLIIFFLTDQRLRLRRTLYLGAEVVKLVLVAVMLVGIFNGESYETRIPLLPGIELVLRANALGMFFLTLSAVLWLLTTVYAIGYLKGSPNRSRFFGFFGLCVTSTAGIALSGNLLTFLLFYEMLSLVTYPLVVHTQTEAALRAGRTYLTYTLIGGTVMLAGVVWLYALAGSVDFTPGGALNNVDGNQAALTLIFFLLIVGLGVKTALVPLHGWLPQAMVAPAPVSALLHAVAVVKAGAFGVVRVVYEVYGVELSQALGVLGPLGVIAGVTIIYGSVMALFQDDLKRRLAYSTVSQLSYITLGVTILGSAATVGGIVHLVHQGIMKITLFFCAGLLAETLGIKKISAMNGVARRMPWTMIAFTIGAAGMIGLPPTAGFVSKWYLGVGAAQSGSLWALAVLTASAVLNAGYFLPILYRAWIKKPDGPFTEKRPKTRFEANWLMLAPPLITAALVLAAGLFATSDISPLEWSKLIADRELPYVLEDIGP